MPTSVFTAGGSGIVMLTSSTVGLLLEPPKAGLLLERDPNAPEETVLAMGVRLEVEMKTRTSNSLDCGPSAVLISTVTGSWSCVLLFVDDGSRSIS